ncbi:hypothetical protein LWI28_026866 [Acer negundo]|uniref:Uncharacterized protein n=1 Tax=Acer negundo TaxID=4023 RepID=A0AAD5JFE8_ACENE|nr:hypothetical protein LWI28_026866 [Acer negundo]KAK4855858.1 hypothetical protein QYF36_011753 [Acer negundo]
MAHSLTTSPPPPSTSFTTTPPISINSIAFQRVCTNTSHQTCNQLSTRRNVSLGLVGAVLGLSFDVIGGDRNVYAAARRPPPPPTGEKKDPNVSGVQAKVLASKKRKEAMKQAVAKLREKGKAVINEPSDSQ